MVTHSLKLILFSVNTIEYWSYVCYYDAQLSPNNVLEHCYKYKVQESNLTQNVYYKWTFTGCKYHNKIYFILFSLPVFTIIYKLKLTSTRTLSTNKVFMLVLVIIISQILIKKN